MQRTIEKFRLSQALAHSASNWITALRTNCNCGSVDEKLEGIFYKTAEQRAVYLSSFIRRITSFIFKEKASYPCATLSNSPR
jgi:hypothetical protein